LVTRAAALFSSRGARALEIETNLELNHPRRIDVREARANVGPIEDVEPSPDHLALTT
jgi:hypothetical protein